MSDFKRTRALPVLSLLLALLGGCASNLIEVREHSLDVAVGEAGGVGQCVRKGKTTVRVLDKIGFISRSIADVDANLLQLARNDAVEMGGDTLVPGERPEIGKRTFAIFKCRP